MVIQGFHDIVLPHGGHLLLDGGAGGYLDLWDLDSPAYVYASYGPTVVFGSPFGDAITTGSYNDSIYEYGGQDYVDVGDGNNFLSLASDTFSVGVGGNGNDEYHLYGSGTIFVNDSGGDNVFYASGDGAKYIDSGAGSDFYALSQTTGPVSVYDPGGSNTIIGGDGNTTVTAGDGNDTIITHGGSDTVDAGKGDNTMIDSGGFYNSLAAGSGNDYYYVTLSDGGYTTILDVGGESTVYANGGGDLSVKLVGNTSATLDLSNTWGINTVNADEGNITVKGGSGIDNITTGNGDDVIDVGGGANSVNAGDGNNVVTAPSWSTSPNMLVAGSGNDFLSGGSGDDFILSQDGLDVLLGNAGNDTLVGGGFLRGGSGRDYAVATTDNTTIALSLLDTAVDYHSGGTITFDPVSGTQGPMMVYTNQHVILDLTKTDGVTANDIFQTPFGTVVNNEHGTDLEFVGVFYGDTNAAISRGDIVLPNNFGDSGEKGQAGDAHHGYYAL